MEKISRLLVSPGFLGKSAVYTALASAVFLASHANAQLLHNITMGNPKALGLANAVTADPPGIDSIHFNPAGLAKIKGRQRQVKLLVAHMELESQFGEPTLPEPGIKEALYDIKPSCQADFPDTAEGHNECWGFDSGVAGRSSSSEKPALMLPFAGMTELPLLAIPTGGIAFEDSTHGWTFGTAVYSPEGVGFTRDEDDPGAFQGISVGITRLTYFSPTIAIELTDTLSVGAGINFSYQGMGIKTKFRAPLVTTQFLASLDETAIADILDLDVIGPYDTVGTLEIELEDFLSVGFNFGMLWEPYEWVSFGFAYQSEKVSHMSGDFRMTNTDEFYATTTSVKASGLDAALILLDGQTFNAQRVEEGSIELDYITPQNIAFGTSVKVLPNLKINFDIKWIEYSVWDTLDFKFDRKADFLTLASVVNSLAGLDDADPDEMRIPRKYEDVWSFAIGGEYQLNDNFVLRAGYEPRGSAIPDDRVDLLFPITEADLYTVGFGWQMDKTRRIEGAFGYLYSESDTPAGGSKNANSNTEGDVVYNPYFSTPFSSETNAYLFTLSYDEKF